VNPTLSLTHSYGPIFMIVGFSLFIACAMFGLATLLGPKVAPEDRGEFKDTPFESGSPSTGASHVKLSVKFYLTAILFVSSTSRPSSSTPGRCCSSASGGPGSSRCWSFLSCSPRARLLLEEGSPRMAELSTETRVLGGAESGFVTTRFDALLNWARKYSLFQYPFVTACCGMEFISPWPSPASTSPASAPRPRASRRARPTALGRGHHQPAPGPRAQAHLRADGRAQVGDRLRHLRLLRRLLRQLHDGAGHRQSHPHRRVRPRLPAAPEAVIDGLLLLQDKIARGDRTPVHREAPDRGAGTSSGSTRRLVQLG
jgi:NADH-quinone oxidoreductase subunit B